MSASVRERFYQWITSWHISSSRKDSMSTGSPSSVSTSSNFSSGSTASALRDRTKLSSSNLKKVVRFAEQDGKVVAEVINVDGWSNVGRDVGPLQESLEEVYIKNGLLSGFITVKNLEPGRQVLVRYTENNWKAFKQTKPRQIRRVIDSKGREKIKFVKEKNSILSRRRKRVKPGEIKVLSKNAEAQNVTYLFKIQLDSSNVHYVELVVISSFEDVIDTNHQQCYLLKNTRPSWEASDGPSLSGPSDIYEGSTTRHS